MTLENRNEKNGRESVERSGERRAPEASRVADREVPLTHHETSPGVHAWLDGELPESVVRFGETAREVDFWKRINGEVDRRRDMRTPPYVYEQIMSSLPQTVPAEQSRWRKHVHVTPATGLTIGAVILAVGAVVALLVLQLL